MLGAFRGDTDGGRHSIVDGAGGGAEISAEVTTGCAIKDLRRRVTTAVAVGAATGSVVIGAAEISAAISPSATDLRRPARATAVVGVGAAAKTSAASVTVEISAETSPGAMDLRRTTRTVRRGAVTAAVASVAAAIVVVGAAEISVVSMVTSGADPVAGVMVKSSVRLGNDGSGSGTDNIDATGAAATVSCAVGTISGTG